MGISKMKPQEDFSFAELNSRIKLVEQDTSGLTEAEQDPVELDKAYKWISTRGWALTIVLVVIWPLLSIPAGKFTQDYFAFWVLVAIAWGFGAAIIITFLPLLESMDVLAASKKPAAKEVDDFDEA